MIKKNKLTKKMIASAIKINIAHALNEDLGPSDLSSNLLDDNIRGQAKIKIKETAILCGKPWVEECFKQIDKNIKITWLVEDGDKVKRNQTICILEGFFKSILKGERVALNFLQSLSGTATSTAHFRNLIKDTSAKIFDTRKTIPGLRIAQKYAVLIGGGHNQRIGLFDQILLKENHKTAYGSIENMLKNIERFEDIQIEVENIKELDKALFFGAKNILLDNFSVEELKKSVKLNNGTASLEASGNINEKNVLAYARTGVDRISLGAITKNIKAIDFSMLFSAQKPTYT
ncbi:MAG: carboxylating nicotinate-nucleotide diphosphorylase [Nitrosomonadales bacterium]|nr:carboxylating nicotinate-nucleotide diphosphorylase [Nitrosomonadales bacterium]MBT6251196.1 carboxylating nicotinate-nucleotide diphosphorylase [Nitrosomonadales bacterium]